MSLIHLERSTIHFLDMVTAGQGAQNTLGSIKECLSYADSSHDFYFDNPHQHKFFTNDYETEPGISDIPALATPQVCTRPENIPARSPDTPEDSAHVGSTAHSPTHDDSHAWSDALGSPAAEVDRDDNVHSGRHDNVRDDSLRDGSRRDDDGVEDSVGDDDNDDMQDAPPLLPVLCRDCRRPDVALTCL